MNLRPFNVNLWEYSAIWADYAEIDGVLNSHGAQGWELVTAQLNAEGRWYCILKRQVAP